VRLGIAQKEIAEALEGEDQPASGLSVAPQLQDGVSEEPA
jgi:hypothetical protein